MSSAFRRTGGETAWEGRMVSVEVATFRHEDGEEVTREIVRHPGAVAIVAVEDEHVWLVRQPREATGDGALLELPAGKVDAGETPLESGRRELAEEVGRAARRWTPLTWCWSSPGFTDERVDVLLAEDLEPAAAAAEDDERIELVRWPLADLDEAIRVAHDAKTLVGLLLLRERRRRG